MDCEDSMSPITDECAHNLSRTDLAFNSIRHRLCAAAIAWTEPITRQSSRLSFTEWHSIIMAIILQTCEMVVDYKHATAGAVARQEFSGPC